MQAEIRVPEVGESITEGVLVSWARSDGEWVEVDDPLFELETEKITMTVSAQQAGKLLITVGPETTVKVGQVVGSIDTGAEQAAARPSQPATTTSATVTSAPTTSAPAAAVAGLSSPSGPAAAAPEGPLAPSVRRLVAEHDLDPRTVPASGKDGRLTKGDVLQHLSGSAAAAPAPQPERSAPTATPAATSEISPRATAQPPAPGVASATAQPAGSAGDKPRQTRTRMTTMRRRIADRLVASQQQAAILTTFNECDMTGVIAWRQRFKERFKEVHGVGLGFMSFFVKAVVDALQQVPALNAQIDGEEIVQNHFYDIGVAVGTPHGLVVPVIRDADRLGFAAIEQRIVELAEKAKTKRLTLNDLSGGSFTISNGGVYGSLLSTPILNPPQSGILGMHGIKRRPVAVGEQIEIRPMMYLAVSYDHRLVDGAEAVTFLKRVVACIEDPERLALEV